MIHKTCMNPISTSCNKQEFYPGLIEGNYCHECSVSVKYEEIWFGSKDSYIRHKRDFVPDNLG